MLRRVVERVEVVVDGLDLGPLGDAEAEPEEHVLDLAPHGRDHVQPADGHGGGPGQGDVDRVGGQASVELAPLELRAAGVERGLERPARLVGGPADGAPLLGRQLGDAAQQVGQLGLAPEVRDPGGLELGGPAGGRDVGLGPGAQGVDLLDHRRAS